MWFGKTSASEYEEIVGQQAPDRWFVRKQDGPIGGPPEFSSATCPPPLAKEGGYIFSHSLSGIISRPISESDRRHVRRCFDLAQRCGLPPVIGANTATREQTPETYLNQLLIVLRKAGLVCSVRGLQGSHVLACSPARIILAEAVVALEGSISPAEGLDAPAPSMTGSGASATQDSAARSSMAVLML